MNQPDYSEFKSNLTDAISNEFASEPVNKIERIRETVTKQLEQVVADGKLMTLESDEVQLLIGYRMWKLQPTSATGVFHFRKP